MRCLSQPPPNGADGLIFPCSQVKSVSGSFSPSAHTVWGASAAWRVPSSGSWGGRVTLAQPCCVGPFLPWVGSFPWLILRVPRGLSCTLLGAGGGKASPAGEQWGWQRPGHSQWRPAGQNGFVLQGVSAVGSSEARPRCPSAPGCADGLLTSSARLQRARGCGSQEEQLELVCGAAGSLPEEERLERLPTGLHRAARSGRTLPVTRHESPRSPDLDLGCAFRSLCGRWSSSSVS